MRPAAVASTSASRPQSASSHRRPSITAPTASSTARTSSPRRRLVKSADVSVASGDEGDADMSYSVDNADRSRSRSAVRLTKEVCR
jgi:hypothetical protein